MYKVGEGIGITFDDVLLVPRFSSIKSRKDVNTSTNLTRRIRLNIPLVSASMDTVTESKMAIAMAREGGIGVIHRFMPIEQQASEVRKVKRAESIIIENPYRISVDASVSDARRIMEQHEVTGLIVVRDGDYVEGILTRRDILFERDDSRVRDAMTPKHRLVTAREGVTTEEAIELIRQHKVEKIPIVDDGGRIKGLITARDIISRGSYPNASRDSKGRLMVAAAVGVKEDCVDRARALYDAEVDLIVVDVAHGHTEQVLSTMKRIRRELGDSVELIAGNVATPEGFEDLASLSDCVKVGVGPGSVCTTRVVAGVGVPQLSAIINCAEASERTGVPMMADGGIRSSADLVKALAGGADTVMLGMLLAGTDESPGTMVVRNGRKYKIYRGMASFYAMLAREGKTSGGIADELLDEVADYSYIAEGIEAYVDYRGSVSDVVKQLISGLRSGLSYCGARDLRELRRNAVFIRITEAALREGAPHDVEKIS
ncbi:MAG: IMP dehydrogenase [Aigarchaeota archaeon]|nr:IMP dehydrogenase [Aigarchaeota archaeon]MDW8092411.1 IMP dehydrogenase [Nitrososphaerota archaeon]